MCRHCRPSVSSPPHPPHHPSGIKKLYGTWAKRTPQPVCGAVTEAAPLSRDDDNYLKATQTESHCTQNLTWLSNSIPAVHLIRETKLDAMNNTQLKAFLVNSICIFRHALFSRYSQITVCYTSLSNVLARGICFS